MASALFVHTVECLVWMKLSPLILNQVENFRENPTRACTHTHTLLLFFSLFRWLARSSAHTSAQTIPQVEYEHTHINHAMHYNSIEKTKDTNTVCLFPIHSLSK